MTLLLRVPLITPKGNMLSKREALIKVDPNTYHIIGDINITDYSGKGDGQRILTPTQQEVLALELIVEDMPRQAASGRVPDINLAVSNIVKKLVDDHREKVGEWANLEYRLGNRNGAAGAQNLAKDLDIPPWMALYLINAQLHGSDKWNPYGQHETDALKLSAAGFIRTYHDRGFEYSTTVGRLELLLLDKEKVRLPKNRAGRLTLRRWRLREKMPKSIRGLQELHSKQGITLPLHDTDKMFEALLALANQVHYHGSLSKTWLVTLTVPSWKALNTERPLESLDARLGQFSAGFLDGEKRRSQTLYLKPPAAQGIARLLYLMGVPQGRKAANDSGLLIPVRQALNMLNKGVNERQLQEYVEDSFRIWAKFKGELAEEREWGNVLRIRLFPDRWPLPPRYHGGKLWIKDTQERETLSVREHTDLIQYLFPGIRVRVMHYPREPDTTRGFYTRPNVFVISEPDRILQKFPELRPAYEQKPAIAT